MEPPPSVAVLKQSCAKSLTAQLFLEQTAETKAGSYGRTTAVRGRSEMIFYLNNGYGAAVFKPDGTLIETNMDDIEDIEIVASKRHLQSCLKY